MPLIDAFKAVASQLIVLHHLSAYGPLAEALEDLAPTLSGWLFDYARMAVQVFLVIAGFLAVRGMAPDGRVKFEAPWALIGRRYLRLVLPFMTAVCLAILLAAVARYWMIDDSIPNPPTLKQWLAHAALLHGVLGHDALSAGVWYIAIDFQLFALLAITLWLGQRSRIAWAAPILVMLLGLAALFHFNRDAEWDNWALYFFGSYALGAAAWWASGPRRLFAWLGVIAVVAIGALEVDFRLRIAIALCVALSLGFARRTGWLQRWPTLSGFDFLGRISYSVFLVHFPICLVVNALFLISDADSTSATLISLASAWGLSVVAGWLFHRHVEAGPFFNQLAVRIETAVGQWRAPQVVNDLRPGWQER